MQASARLEHLPLPAVPAMRNPLDPSGSLFTLSAQVVGGGAFAVQFATAAPGGAPVLGGNTGPSPLRVSLLEKTFGPL